MAGSGRVSRRDAPGRVVGAAAMALFLALGLRAALALGEVAEPPGLTVAAVAASR